MPERAMYPFTREEDALLWERHGSGSAAEDFEETAALLGRGAKSLTSQLERLRNPSTAGHMRLFGAAGGDDDAPAPKKLLRTALDCVQRVLWDPMLVPADFTVYYSDRFDSNPRSFAMDRPNDSIQGPERLLVLALPQHRILFLKYKKRLVWHRQLRLDRVFGSGFNPTPDVALAAGGAGEAASVEEGAGVGRIQDVVETYGAWAAADALVRSRAKARARRALSRSAGLKYRSVDERLKAVSVLLSSARDGELTAEELARVLLDSELFGPAGGREAPGGEGGEGDGGVERALCPAEELVAAVVPEEHGALRSEMLTAIVGRVLR